MPKEQRALSLYASAAEAASGPRPTRAERRGSLPPLPVENIPTLFEDMKTIPEIDDEDNADAIMFAYENDAKVQAKMLREFENSKNKSSG